MLLLSIVRRILGIFHLIVELEERIFYIIEARWWGLAVARGADGRHVGGLSSNRTLEIIPSYQGSECRYVRLNKRIYLSCC